MNELPDKIKRIDVLRVEHGKQKMCQCMNPHYEIDHQNRLVRCTDCDAIVDPLDAITEIARHYDRINSQVEILLEQRKQILNYQPRRVVIKELERLYNNKNMIPTCPHCDKAFELGKLVNGTWRNREYAKQIEERSKNNE